LPRPGVEAGLAFSSVKKFIAVVVFLQ